MCQELCHSFERGRYVFARRLLAEGSVLENGRQRVDEYLPTRLQ